MSDEYNLRQMELMKKRIDEYSKGEIMIDKLLSDLEALLGNLKNINNVWKSSFLSAWGILEEVYAFALYDKKSLFDNNDMLKINEGLKKILNLIGRKIWHDVNIFQAMKDMNVLSWSAIYHAYKNKYISKYNIESYAVSLLTKESFYNDTVALLADIKLYEQDQIEEMILDLVKKNNSTDRLVDLDKLKMAVLSALSNSELDNEEKCERLQQIYAEFDYPEDMQECSIYHNSKISPIEAMHLLIASLKKQILLHTKTPEENKEQEDEKE